MFKNFGYRDAISGIFKYKKILSCVIILSVFVGVMMGMTGLNSPFNGKNPDERYIESSLFYINPNIDTPTMRETRSFNAAMNSEICRAFVFGQLSLAFQKEELEKRLENEIENYETKILDMNIFGDIVTIEILDDSYIVSISVETGDKEISSLIISGYEKFAVENLTEMIKPASISIFRGQSRTVEHPLNSDGTPSRRGISYRKIVLYTFASSVSFGAVYIISCFILLALHPTLNRKSDFEQYNIPVIGEL